MEEEQSVEGDEMLLPPPRYDGDMRLDDGDDDMPGDDYRQRRDGRDDGNDDGDDDNLLWRVGGERKNMSCKK